MEALAQAKLVVVKIGSALLVDATSGALRSEWLGGLAEDVAWLRGLGKKVILVSSGSISLGRRVLKLPHGALALEQAQAAAAVGQIRLARAYQEVLSPYGIEAAQVLVTLEDSENRRRYLNSRATFATLLELGTVPIVNENDTVATDEIRFGDNDRLAAQVAAMAGADVLVLLSDVDGLYSGDPRVDPTAVLIPVVENLTPALEAMAGGAGSAGAKGGMKTKLMAAKVATQAGCAMAITIGDRVRPLQALADGASATWFLAKADPQVARKKWIGAMKPRGRVVIDAGAVAALGRGKSLLPAGVTGVEGRFGRGDPVDIVSVDGSAVAKGLIGYDASDALLIMGSHSRDIEAKLGHPGRAALIHRDDMAI